MNRDQVDRGEEQTKAENHSSAGGGRVLSAPVLRFDLMRELEGLRQHESYSARAPTGKTLLKERDLRIVLMALRAGGRMEEHHASGPISIGVILGRFRLQLPNQSIELGIGELLALEPGIPHDVLALEDTALLLTIGRTTYQDVSDRHELRT